MSDTYMLYTVRDSEGSERAEGLEDYDEARTLAMELFGTVTAVTYRYSDEEIVDDFTEEKDEELERALDEFEDVLATVVMEGIAKLDAEGPADWRTRIDPTTLHMESPFQCVLGQVYANEPIVDSTYRFGLSGYAKGLQALHIAASSGNPDSSSDYGFSLPFEISDAGLDDVGYARLTQLWVMALNQKTERVEAN